MTPPSGLRILMTTDAVGGVWVYASALARALCAAGNQVLLVVMGPAPRPEQIWPLRCVRGLTVRLTDLALEWIDPDGADLDRARTQLLRLAAQFRPDVVHLNSFREGSFAWPARVLIVAHSCVHTWWRACRGTAPDERRWHVYTERVAAGLSAVDAWVAPTAAFLQQITTTYQPPIEGRVIRNGLTIRPAVMSGKQPVILAAGRLWDEAKNLRALTSVAPALPWPVHVAGPLRGPDGPVTEAASACVRLLGDLSNADLIDEMGRAAIFAAPSLYEPFGLGALEAAASGCALVLADLPGFHELWGDAALFVDPRDHDLLRAALQKLCHGSRLRHRLQAAARARSHFYSQTAMVRAYQRLYGELTAAPVEAPIDGTSVVEVRA